jgi:hypothetical protein
MKNIKQIREAYDSSTRKEDSDNRRFTSLVRAGLYDAKKLPALKRAFEKGPDHMTAIEKRMLLNLLDSLMAQVVSNQPVYQKVRTNVLNMSEAKEFEPEPDGQGYLAKYDPRGEKGQPKPSTIPAIIILKRKAIRVYPDHQKVALYYAQAIDKYVTIPFGIFGDGGIAGSMNEEVERKPTKVYRKKIQEEKAVLPASRSSKAVLPILKQMINENIVEKNIRFGEREITINNTVAKKIMSVHESMNRQNKKTMENALNESIDSFNKVVTFATRY